MPLDMAWVSREADWLRRMQEERDKDVQARREGRKLGKLPRGLVKSLQRCNPLQLKAAITFCRQLLKDHGKPPEAYDCGHRGRAPLMNITIGESRYQLEMSLSCGKAACTKCPHGPYLYGYHRDGDIAKATYYGNPLRYKRKPPRKVATAVRQYTEARSKEAAPNGQQGTQV